MVTEELGLVAELKELNTKSREELAELKELNVTMKALLETLSKNWNTFSPVISFLCITSVKAEDPFAALDHHLSE